MTVRIIGGEFKRRNLHTPRDANTARPLPDRVRTSLFNMLQGHIEGEEVYDSFAGVGTFGFEAVSRGAARVVMVERHKGVLDLLRRTIDDLGVHERAELVPADALGPAALARCPRPAHIVFMDPPYPMMQDPASRTRVMDQFARLIQNLDDDGFAILRTPLPYVDVEPDEDPDKPGIRHPVPLDVPGAIGPETHEYGSMALHWYMRERG